MRELHRPTVAILASGSGSTAEGFIRRVQVTEKQMLPTALDDFLRVQGNIDGNT